MHIRHVHTWFFFFSCCCSDTSCVIVFNLFCQRELFWWIWRDCSKNLTVHTFLCNCCCIALFRIIFGTTKGWQIFCFFSSPLVDHWRYTLFICDASDLSCGKSSGMFPSGLMPVDVADAAPGLEWVPFSQTCTLLVPWWRVPLCWHWK